MVEQLMVIAIVVSGVLVGFGCHITLTTFSEPDVVTAGKLSVPFRGLFSMVTVDVQAS
jgi:hypothetical protein